MAVFGELIDGAKQVTGYDVLAEGVTLNPFVAAKQAVNFSTAGLVGRSNVPAPKGGRSK